MVRDEGNIFTCRLRSESRFSLSVSCRFIFGVGTVGVLSWYVLCQLIVKESEVLYLRYWLEPSVLVKESPCPFKKRKIDLSRTH